MSEDRGKRQRSKAGGRESGVRCRGSEGMGQGVTPVAQVMADTARELGVRPEDMVVETASRDTEDLAVIIGMIG